MLVVFEIIKSVIYGIVQGITEWLPISSTGHLILVNAFLPLKVFADPAENQAFWDMYKVVIQFGSILAVLVLYFHRLNPFSSRKSDEEKKATWSLWSKIVVGSVPVGIIGFLLDDIVDEKLSTPLVVGLMLIVYGLLFIWMELRRKKARIRKAADMDYKTAFLIGCFESLALIPGTSRSGSTILGATMLGASRGVATEFSFFMAIPAMAGASLLKIIKMDASLNAAAFAILMIGVVVSFVVSVIVIRSFLKYIRKHDFRMFGLYRIIIGLIILFMAVCHLFPAGMAV